MISAGASALPLMKASYSPTHMAPLMGLPPEMVERLYMYCTEGRLSIHQVRRLYPAGVLLGMEGITDREIVHRAVNDKLQLELCFADTEGGAFHRHDVEGIYPLSARREPEKDVE